VIKEPDEQSTPWNMYGIFGCVWRGALGGMIGSLGFILFMAAKRPNDALAIAYLPIILPITATVGAMIGLIIGLLHFVRGLRVGRLIGAVIGTTVSTCLWMVYLYFRGNEPQEFSWLDLFGASLLFGLIIGALPGLFSVPKRAVAKGNFARAAGKQNL
jgi:hypothetical protein